MSNAAPHQAWKRNKPSPMRPGGPRPSLHEAIALGMVSILAANEERHLIQRVASDPEAYLACVNAQMQARFFTHVAHRMIYDELVEWYAVHSNAPGRVTLRALFDDGIAIETVDDLELPEGPQQAATLSDVDGLVRALRERSALRHRKAAEVRDRAAKGWVTF